MRLTGQFSVARTKTESSLGLASANINQWGAGVPFGNQPLPGQHEHLFRYPGLAVHGGRPRVLRPGVTNSAYTPNGRFHVNCDAPAGTAGKPWADGQPGCTKSEAWPTSPQVYNLMMTRTALNNATAAGPGNEQHLDQPRAGLVEERARGRALDDQHLDDDELHARNRG